MSYNLWLNDLERRTRYLCYRDLYTTYDSYAYSNILDYHVVRCPSYSASTYVLKPTREERFCERWRELSEFLGRCAQHIFAFKNNNGVALDITLGEKEAKYMGRLGIACAICWMDSTKSTLDIDLSKLSSNGASTGSIEPGVYFSFFGDVPELEIIKFLEQVYLRIALEIHEKKIACPNRQQLLDATCRCLPFHESLKIREDYREKKDNSDSGSIDQAFRSRGISIEYMACRFLEKFLLKVVEKILENSATGKTALKKTVELVINGKINERIRVLAGLWMQFKEDQKKIERDISDSFIFDEFRDKFCISYDQLNLLTAVVETFLKEFLRQFEDHIAVNIMDIRDFIKSKPCFRNMQIDIKKFLGL